MNVFFESAYLRDFTRPQRHGGAVDSRLVQEQGIHCEQFYSENIKDVRVKIFWSIYFFKVFTAVRQ